MQPGLGHPPAGLRGACRDHPCWHQRLRPHRPQLLPCRPRAGRRHRGRRCERPDRQQDARPPAEVRHASWAGCRRTCPTTTRTSSSAAARSGCSKSVTPRTCRGRSSAPTSSSSRPASSPTPPRPRRTSTAVRTKVIISAPAKNEDVTVVLGANEGDYDPADAPHHLDGLVHDELPRADGQGAQRLVRHRDRPDDDHPRLHRRPEPPGRSAQGPPPGARRGRQHRADQHRCGEGDLPRAARAQGQARRVRDPRADPDRLGHRPHRHRPSARRRSTRSTPRSRRRPRARSRVTSPTPRTRSSPPTS